MTLATTIQYTPFVETSFGYGTTELNTWFTNPTDIVKVRIDGFSGFDRTTGHISTPSVGTAVSTFNTHNYVWQVVGERDDVNAVLSKLKYFPQDYEDARIWSPIRTKTNVISGGYGSSEEPPAIPDVSFRIKVYDANDVLDGRDYSIIAEAINTGYGNQRPYWSTEPAVQDCSSLGIPPYIDLGTINHGSDTENVNVKCEFRNYGSSSTYTGGAYGQFTLPTRFYIGDKKEGDINSSDARFNFTGSVIDTQAFLDNIGYQRPTVGDTFDMFLTIDDGVAASTLTKTCWFTNTPFTTSHAMPDLTGTEETTITGLNQDASWTINHAPEVNQFYYVITLDPTGTDGVENMLSTVGAGTFSNGVYTSINCVSPEALVLRMNTTQFELKDDFNDNFTYTIQFFGFNSTIGSSYSSAIENVNVVMTGTEEIANATSSHNWTEDTSYNLNTGTVVQINHGYDRDFECRLQISDTNAGVLSATASGSGTATWTSPNLLFVGTRDEVNAMLQTTKFTPTVDYASNFTLSYYQKRVSGETTSDTDDVYNIEIGLANTITMNVIAHDEFSITQPSAIVWNEDVSKIFDSGLQITDLADENIDLPTYQTDYRFEMAMWDNATEFTDGTIVANTTTGLTVGGAGNQNGQGDTNMISYTGSKTDINAALADLRFIPNADYSGVGVQHNVFYKIVRVQDNAVLTNQAQTTKTTFAVGIGHDDYSFTQTNVSWTEDTLVSYDSGLQITDLADENIDLPTYQSDYRVEAKGEYWDGSAWQTLIDVAQFSTSDANVTKSGLGTVASPLIITGSKADVNNALQNMLMIPDPDATQSPQGAFAVRYKITRVQDSSNAYFPNFNAITQFAATTQEDQYSWTRGTDLLSWNMNEFYDLDTEIEILDTADTVIGGLAENSNYRVSARSKYSSDSSDFDLGTFTYTSIGSATVTGDGTVSNPLVITGTKTDVNTALENLRFIPSVDANPTSAFRLEFKIERILYPVTFLNYTNSINFTDTPVDNRAYISRQTYTWTEEVAQDFDTGLVINEIVTTEPTVYPNYYDTEYKIEMQPMTSDGLTLTDQCKFAQSAAMSLLTLNNITGNDTNQFSFEGKKADINSALDSVTFRPNPDEIDPIYIAYKITRLHDSTVIWDFSVSSTADFGTATDTTEYYAGYIAHSFDIGSLTGNVHTLLNGLDVGITDTAEDTTNNVTYEVTLEIGDRSGVAPSWGINPPVNDFVQFNANPYVERDYFDIIDYVENNTVVITGTKSQVNDTLQNLEFYVDLAYPHDDSQSGFDPELLYTQKRFINGILDATHVERDLLTRLDW
jgi:hypothetical protein